MLLQERDYYIVVIKLHTVLIRVFQSLLVVKYFAMKSVIEIKGVIILSLLLNSKNVNICQNSNFSASSKD